MKKIILSLLTIGALTGCANEESTPLPGETALVPIQLTAGVLQIGTKAPAPTTGKFTFAVAGWSGLTAKYDVAEAWKTTGEIQDVTSLTASPITWGTQPYYNLDDTQNTYIQAWYPTTGTVTNGIVAFTNTVGDVDVMMANSVSGTKASVNLPALEFTHKTTQLIFKVKKSAEVTETIKIIGISIASAGIPTGIDYTIATPAVTYTATTDLDVPNAVEKEVLTTDTTIGDPLMIQTPSATKQLTLTVTTDKGTFDNVTATIDGAENFKEGTAYTITLTIKMKQISGTAKITGWVSGTGSGDII